MDSAEWPSQPVPEAVKRTLERFYKLIDSTDPCASDKLARKVFVEDGEFVVNKRIMSGREEIANWHKNGEDIVAREHRVDKLYVCNAEGDDLLMTGTLTMESDVGLIGSTSYTARCVIDDPALPMPKVRRWQFWLDPTPFFDLGIMRPPARQLNASGILDTIGGR
ncbi:hypothetical protein LTR62_006233 [Meristemomyces frigidus]|uniref:SnoaL-like domain-containing protein n=1 Tax=Meristemomyces frigidus TaxID=1508187 RepID=A0AAN7TCK0_9PEZI|nr:hypothetical protein LTR62_006233 [Meristemomyces frigidus]